VTLIAATRAPGPRTPAAQHQQPSPPRTSWRDSGLAYLAPLDGMRGLAVPLVFGGHFAATWFPGALFALDVLFVLSGYFVTRLLLLEHERYGASDLHVFYVRRALRVLSALFVVVAVLTFLAVLLPPRVPSAGPLVSATCYRVRGRLPRVPPFASASSDCVAVVLNYDNAGFTQVAVRAVLGQDPAPAVVVVDNGSRTHERALLRAVLPDGVDLLELPENLGVPGGLGPGLQRALDARADRVLIVLNDTALEPGALALLHRCLDDDPRLGAVAPLQVRYDDPEVVVTTGSRLHRAPWLVSARDSGRQREQVQRKSPVEPDYLDFTCLLVRSQVLRQVGLPRAEFRFYWDDAEWGTRVRRAGWRLAVEPRAVVRHRVSGTLSADKGSTATYYQYRNRLLAKRRLDGRAGVARVLAQEPVLLLARALARGSDGGGTRLQARAAWDYLRRAPYPPM